MLHHPDAIARRHECHRSQRYVGAICQTAVLLVLATGLGCGFGSVIERLASLDQGVGASVLIATNRSHDQSQPFAGRIESIADLPLGTQHEIGPRIANNSGYHPVQPPDVSDGASG